MEESAVSARCKATRLGTAVDAMLILFSFEIFWFMNPFSGRVFSCHLCCRGDGSGVVKVRREGPRWCLGVIFLCLETQKRYFQRDLGNLFYSRRNGLEGNDLI